MVGTPQVSVLHQVFEAKLKVCPSHASSESRINSLHHVYPTCLAFFRTLVGVSPHTKAKWSHRIDEPRWDLICSSKAPTCISHRCLKSGQSDWTMFNHCPSTNFWTFAGASTASRQVFTRRTNYAILSCGRASEKREMMLSV